MARATLALLLVLALGGGCGSALAGDREDVAKLTQLSNAWDQAIVAKQQAAVANNMAEDFRIIDGYGNVDGKKKFVEDILDARLTIDPYTVEDFEVRLYGDTALLSGRTHMTGKYDGKPFDSNYRYIDIYVRRNGEWKIVSVQITKFPKPEQQPAARNAQ
ncbi:MAG TPA: nuclear transport factor 2 family protein [Steroidobacteraceae bacterium]|nr:nuclear transport factor 2 family protein [Steroidobacteraceae bacterium]